MKSLRELFSKPKPVPPETPGLRELIDDQMLKESAETYRRGWCIMQATMCYDDCTADELIRMAEKIYEHVYGEKP